MIDWSVVRAEFPALDSWTFLNTATFGQLPVRATDAVTRHFRHRDELACSDFLSWFSDADGLRKKIAELIHAASDDIAFIPAASHALSLLIGGMSWKPGDQIVTLENEFPNNIYFPALLKSQGVELIETSIETFQEAITDRTRLVAVSALSYITGVGPSLVEMGKFLKERNILFYVDGTQGCGALHYDVREFQPDIFAVHGYKWMLAPNGAGFMYVAPEIREWLQPQVIGWRSDQNWRSVDQLQQGAPEFKKTAERYEGAMLCHSVLYAMEASVDLMLEIGPAEIEKRVLELATVLRQQLKNLGAEFSSPNPSPILAVKFPGHDSVQIVAKLKEHRVLVSSRQGWIRISVHFYNNEADIACLIAVLRKSLES